jgi:hypothetical protein
MIEPISVSLEPSRIAAGAWVDIDLKIVNGANDPLDDVVVTLKPPWQVAVKKSTLRVAHLVPSKAGRVSVPFKASSSAPPSLDFAVEVHYYLAGKPCTQTTQLHLEVQPKVEARSEKSKSRAADSAEVISLKRQLAIHQRNLRTLEEQKAKYGSLDVPLRIVNEIAEQEEAIARIQARLAQIEGHAPISPQASSAASPAGKPGATYNIHIEHASNLAIGDGAWVVQGSGEAGSRGDADAATSLRRELAEAEASLALIREREAQYVMEVDVPLQLIKEERRLLARIAELKAGLGE